jgi:hypothetical protein
LSIDNVLSITLKILNEYFKATSRNLDCLTDDKLFHL